MSVLEIQIQIYDLLLDVYTANVQVLKNQEYLLSVPTVGSLEEKEALLDKTRDVLRTMEENIR